MKIAIYARVSTDEQTELNQIPVLEQWAKQRGYEIVKIYRDVGSAWQKSDQRELKILLEDARKGQFDAVMVWAVDRLSRGGIGTMFQIIDRLAKYKIRVISHEESWTEVPSELYPLMLSLFAWIANQESKRISERTKLGMARAKEQGKHVGRPRK